MAQYGYLLSRPQSVNEVLFDNVVLNEKEPTKMSIELKYSVLFTPPKYWSPWTSLYFVKPLSLLFVGSYLKRCWQWFHGCAYKEIKGTNEFRTFKNPFLDVLVYRRRILIVFLVCIFDLWPPIYLTTKRRVKLFLSLTIVFWNAKNLLKNSLK